MPGSFQIGRKASRWLKRWRNGLNEAHKRMLNKVKTTCSTKDSICHNWCRNGTKIIDECIKNAPMDSKRSQNGSQNAPWGPPNWSESFKMALEAKKWSQWGPQEASKANSGSKKGPPAEPKWNPKTVTKNNADFNTEKNKRRAMAGPPERLENEQKGPNKHGKRNYGRKQKY